MSRTQTTAPRGEERKIHILNATLRLISCGGVDSVTHRRVAEAAGVPLGSTTYHFASREHLLQEAFEYYLQAWTTVQLEAMSEPIETVSAFVDCLVEITKREFEDEGMLLTEYELTLFAARNPKIAAALHNWDEFLLESMANTMKSLGASKPKDAARTILNLIRGYELDSLSKHKLDSVGFRRRLTSVVSALVSHG